jgi:hypothetical protein
MAGFRASSSQKFSFDRLTQLIIRTNFYDFPSFSDEELTVVDEGSGMSFYHASRLYNWPASLWIPEVRDELRAKEISKAISRRAQASQSEGRLFRSSKKVPISVDHLDLAYVSHSADPSQKVIERTVREEKLQEFEAFRLAKEYRDLQGVRLPRKAERLGRIEDFAFQELINDIDSHLLSVPDFPEELRETPEYLKRWFRQKALSDQQKKTEKPYDCPIFVYWLSLHGISIGLLQRGYEAIQVEIQSEDVLEEGQALDAREMDRGDKLHNMMSQFSLQTQSALWCKDFLFSLFFGCYRQGEEIINELLEIDEESEERIKSAIKKMILELTARITTSRILVRYQPDQHREQVLPAVLGSPSGEGRIHFHRPRRLTEVDIFSHKQDALVKGSPGTYLVNPLHLVLEYLNAAIRQYDESSSDYQILSRKREIVTQYCQSVDSKTLSLVKAIEELLTEQDLYERRNRLDPRTPRTVRLVKACLEGPLAVKKLLPAGRLGNMKMGQIDRALQESTV